MSWDALDTRLEALRASHRERTLRDWQPDDQPGYLRVGGARLLDLASNDYLGLSRRAWTPESAREALRAHLSPPEVAVVTDALGRFGAGSARLITGNHPVYALLERELADLKGQAAALVFGSGVAANTGVIPALVGRGDAVFSDALNHASIIDGVRLSRAETHIYPNRDLRALDELLSRSAAPRKLIVTDALFSMDGTLAPLPELVALKRRHGAWLMIDEAHTGGVYGPQGAGLAHARGVSADIDVLMGTLGKAYGSVGAYVAGHATLIRYLMNAARSFIFTTGLPPANVAVSLLNVVQARSMDPERAQLQAHARRLRTALLGSGLDLAGSESHVVPIVLGGEARTLAHAAHLRDAGYAAVAIRPPTVPPGSARVRLALNAAHTWEQLAGCVAALTGDCTPGAPR